MNSVVSLREGDALDHFKELKDDEENGGISHDDVSTKKGFELCKVSDTGTNADGGGHMKVKVIEHGNFNVPGEGYVEVINVLVAHGTVDAAELTTHYKL